jgi:hypothetical protein
VSTAIERIVDAYVRLGNRMALEDFRANRHRLAMELKAIDSSLDLSSSIKQLEDERTIIDAGFAKLKIAAAA